MRRAAEVFVVLHLTRVDDRFDYGEPRYITAVWLDSKLVVLCLDASRQSQTHYQHEALS
jgi:hypothetical protein